MKKVSTTNPSGGSSYGQILRSSSIMGGAQGINYVLGLIRTKVVAVLLGPSGVGLVGLYLSIVGMVQVFAQMGINQSGVREVAAAAGAADSERIAEIGKTLRRACWLTGVAGWILLVFLSWPLSQWAFGSTDKMLALISLGAIILIECIMGGEQSLLQGVRRVGDLARQQIASGVISTLVAVGVYSWLGDAGIVPVLISTSLIQLGVTWHFSRQLRLVKVSQSIRTTLRHLKPLLILGASFMWSGLVGAIVALGIRLLIVRYNDLEAAGVYQAAWAISGLFGGLVISAMGTDFYPRLAGLINDHTAARRLVNEQTEVGIMLMLPGVVGMSLFAPWVIEIMYTTEFAEAATLLAWYMAAVLCRMVTFPLGFILLASQKALRFAMMTTVFHASNIVAVFYLLQYYPLYSIAIANCVLAVVYMVGMRFSAGPLVKFYWSKTTIRLMSICVVIMSASLVITLLASAIVFVPLALLLTITACIVSINEIRKCVHLPHGIKIALAKTPMRKFL